MAKILLNDVDADAVSDVFTSDGGPAVFVVRGDDFDGGMVVFELASTNDEEDSSDTEN